MIKSLLASLDDEHMRKECRALIAMMKRISGKRPKIWNAGTIGFGTYRYKYDSGREGECHTIGFYPRQGKFTVYIMDGTARYAPLLKHLGKHSSSRVCIYFKRLSDIQLPVLEQIVRQSYDYISSRDGQMHRAMEK